jgi:hypothetical protein
MLTSRRILDILGYKSTSDIQVLPKFLGYGASETPRAPNLPSNLIFLPVCKFDWSLDYKRPTNLPF